LRSARRKPPPISNPEAGDARFERCGRHVRAPSNILAGAGTMNREVPAATHAYGLAGRDSDT